METEQKEQLKELRDYAKVEIEKITSTMSDSFDKLIRQPLYFKIRDILDPYSREDIKSYSHSVFLDTEDLSSLSRVLKEGTEEHRVVCMLRDFYYKFTEQISNKLTEQMKTSQEELKVEIGNFSDNFQRELDKMFDKEKEIEEGFKYIIYHTALGERFDGYVDDSEFETLNKLSRGAKNLQAGLSIIKKETREYEFVYKVWEFVYEQFKECGMIYAKANE